MAFILHSVKRFYNAPKMSGIMSEKSGEKIFRAMHKVKKSDIIHIDSGNYLI